MRDEDKTKEQLITELVELRQRISEWEALESDRRRVEEKLRLQAEVLDQIRDAVIAIDNEQQVIYLNQAAAEQYGIKPDDALGCELTELYQYDWLKPEHEQAAYASLAEVGYWSGENIHIKRNGDRIFVESTVSVLKDDSGQDIGMLAVIRDISEHKRAEEQILVANERLQYLLSSTSAVIYTARTSGDYGATFISENVTPMLGYEPREFLEASSFWIDRVHPDDVQRILAELPQIFEQGHYTYEYRFRRQDGTYIWMRDEMKLVRDEEGEPLEIVGYWVDITERKRVTEERERLLIEHRTQRKFLERLVEAAPVGIAVVRGPDHRYEMVNPYYQAIPGVPDVPMVGRTIAEVFPAVAAQGAVELVETVYRTGQTTSLREYEASVGPGREQTYWNVDHVPLYGPDGDVDGVLILASEITEQALARKQVEELAAQDEAILTSMTEGLTLFDLQGNVVDMNPAALRIHGFEQVKEAQRHLKEFPDTFELRYLGGRLMPVEEWPAARVLQGETFSGYEAQVRRLDTGDVWIGSYSGTPVCDKAGNAILGVLTLRDVTAEKKVWAERERLLAQVEQDRESIGELARILEQERDVLQTIMESTHAQLAYFDSQFNFLRVNAAYAQGSGYSREELIGRNHFDLFPHAENQAIFERVKDTGEPVKFQAKPFEYPERPQLGTTYWDWTLVPVKKGRNGQVQGLVLSLLDVTQRERARREREAYLASLSEIIAVSEHVLAETTMEGMLQRVVDAARELTGARLSIAGHSYEEGVFQIGATSRSEDMPPCPSGEDFSVWTGSVYLDLIEGRTAIRLMDEQLRQHPAWQELPEEHIPLRGLLGTRLVGRDGQTTGLIMVSDKKEGDFTIEDEALLVQLAALISLGLQHIETSNEVKRRADELDAERARLKAIIENAPEAIVVTDKECRIVLANPVAERLYAQSIPYGEGLQSHSEMGLCYPDGTPYDPRDLPLARSALDGEVANNLEMAILWPDGQQRDLLASSAPIWDSRGKEVSGAVGVFQDITERRRMERVLQQRNRDLRLLNRLSQELGATLDLPQVLEKVLRAVREVVAAAGSLVWLWDEENPDWIVCCAASHPDLARSPLNLRLRSGEGIIGWVAQHGKIAIVSRAQEDTRFSRVIDAHTGFQTHSILAVPLQVRDAVIGVLEVLNKSEGEFSDHDRLLIETLAASVAIAIENARLYDQAKQTAAAAERSLLARELHDAVSQTLFSASVIAESLPRLWERDPDKVWRGLEQLQQLTRGALAEMRTLLLELRPTALMEAKLGDLLRQLTEAFASRTPVKVSLTVEGQRSLPPEVQIALYRMTQEALNNVTKHARATQVTVSLRSQPEEVELRIQDDGRGFDLGGVQPGRLGLDILRERAEAIGATLQITSQADQGTEIAVIWSDTRQTERKAND
jgi:PAS domain S-box-containing protein